MPNAKTFPASDDVYMDMSKRGCYQNLRSLFRRLMAAAIAVALAPGGNR